MSETKKVKIEKKLCPKCKAVLVSSKHKNHPDAFQCNACGRVWEKDDPQLS